MYFVIIFVKQKNLNSLRLLCLISSQQLKHPVVENFSVNFKQEFEETIQQKREGHKVNFPMTVTGESHPVETKPVSPKRRQGKEYRGKETPVPSTET